MVGRLDQVTVMFDNNNCIAGIFEILQASEKTSRIPFVKADGRLIENVDRSCEPISKLRCQADSLGFAAGKCIAVSAQLKVAEPNVSKEPEPV